MATKKKMLQAAAGGGNIGAWDLSYAYYDPPAAWDVSTARYANKSFDVSSQEPGIRGVFFKPNGTKMYVIGVTGDAVNEYDLSTAWDVSTALFLQQFYVGGQDTSPEALFFKPDGTKMYIAGDTTDDAYEYDLSTAWDVSTASYVQNFPGLDSSPTGLFFKPDGTKMYVLGDNSNIVSEYDLSTAWSISTAVFLQQFSVGLEETIPEGLFFKPDGTKMYVVGNTGDDVNEYDLSTAWDVSSASFLQSFSIAAQDTNPRSVFFDPYGGHMYVSGVTAPAKVYQYTLGGFDISGQEINPIGLSFKPDGTKMYVVGFSGQDINEYDLSTAWDVSSASYLQNFSVAAQETQPRGVFLKPDGTKMYVIGSTGDDVNEYNLSTAWDVSSASFLQNFSVAAQETIPQKIFFKPDGAKMYVVGSAGQAVYEYNLSTAWDVSSASFLQNFSVAAQETNPIGLFFKPDGTKMYVTGIVGDDVNEYNLSTAWDISSASFLQNFSVAAQEASPAGLFFKPEGTQMFIVGFTSDRVFSYTLGPQ